MATLKDIYKAYHDLDVMVRLFGAEPEFLQKFDGLIKAARDAVIEEQGLDNPNKAVALPKETILGEKAQAALEGLNGLLPPQK